MPHPRRSRQHCHLDGQHRVGYQPGRLLEDGRRQWQSSRRFLGHGHDLHLANPPAAPAWSADVPALTGGNGWSLAFDNAGDLSYAFPITQTVGSSELTVETWVKFDQIGGGELPFISASQQYFAQSWALATYGPEVAVTIPNHPYSSNVVWY